MMHTQNEIALIKTTLAEMIAQAERLARITAEEGFALREAEINLLNQKVNDKRDIVACLVKTDNQFRSLLIQLGYDGIDEIGSFLSEGCGDIGLTQHWNQYLDIMKQCDELNRQNSALVNIGLRHTRQAIDFLRSCVGEYTTEPAVYGPGTQSAANNSYMIAKA